MQGLIAVLLSLFLGPGVGQLYNRQFKKGAYLMGLSLLVLIGAVAWFRHACQPYLPANLPLTDRDALQTLLQNAITHVVSTNSSTFYTYEGLLFALWIYSVADAWRGAQKRVDPTHP